MAENRSIDIHRRLAELAGGDPSSTTIVDLGAGLGRTVEELARCRPAARIIAIDTDADQLGRLRERVPAACTVEHDLSTGVPLERDSVDAAVCHNTLECVTDPSKLISEIAGALRPAGRVVLGHTDFETIGVLTDDVELSARVLATYADLPVLYRLMAARDGRMGRRLPGLVAREPRLRLLSVEPATQVLTDIDVAWARRLGEVVGFVERAVDQQEARVTSAELQRWVDELHEAARREDFVFFETAFLVTAARV